MAQPIHPDAWQAVELYRYGFSTREVAGYTGFSKSYVDYLTHKAGVRRTKSEALYGVKRKPESKHWRTNRIWARRLMEQHVGRKLLPTEHVHHINNDFTDNRIENLMITNEGEHHSFHNKVWDIPKEQRPNRIAWKKAYKEKQRRLRFERKQQRCKAI